MEMLTRKNIDNVLKTIQEFKNMIDEKKTEDAIIQYLVETTELPKHECELAYKFFNEIVLLPNNEYDKLFAKAFDRINID